MKSINAKLMAIATLTLVVLVTNVLPVQAATLDDVSRALRELQMSFNQYQAAQAGAVLAATVTTVRTPAELTAALTAATGGETILLAAGNYGAFSVSNKNYTSLVTVTAVSPSNPPTFASFSISSVKNFKLDKIYVAFVPTATTADHHSGMMVTNVENFILSNSVFKSSPNPTGEQVGRGISVTSGNNVTIAGNEVTGSRRGILTGNIDGLAIKHNYVHDIRTSQLSGGVVSNVVIEGNHLRTSRAINFGGAGDHGDFIHYWTQSTQTGPSANFKIINNFMEQAGGTALLGIYMDNNTNPQGFTNVHIENNILHNSNGQGIRLEDVVGAVVKNNSLIQNEGDYRKAPRIRLEDGTKNVVLENNIVANTTAGGAMDDPAGNNLVERRTFIAQNEDSSKDNYAGKIFMKAPILDGEIEDHAVKAGSIGVGYGATLTRSQILQSQIITSPGADGGVITPTPTPVTPTLTLTSSVSRIASGDSATLTWSSVNATACTASGAWTGSKAVNGTQTTGALSTVGTQTYTLACTSTGGTITKSVSVAVTSGTVITPTPVPTGLSRVKLTEDKSVRLRPAGTVAGTQLIGSEGMANFAEAVTTGGHTWANVNFDSGVDGWLPQQYLQVIAVPAPTVTLTSSPASVSTGGSAMLTWSSTNATACTGSGAWTGSKTTTGSQSTGVLSTGGTQTYTLTCTGTGGSISATANVVVSASVVVTPTPIPTTGISIGAIIKTSRDTNVRAAAGVNATLLGTVPRGVQGTVLAGPVALNGFTWWNINFNHSYTDGWSSDTNFTLVAAAPTSTPAPTPVAPTLSLTASPSSLTSGAGATLTWNSANATTCTASGAWTGSKSVNGTQSTGALTSTKTYTLTCTNAGGVVTKSVSVAVTSNPLPATSAVVVPQNTTWQWQLTGTIDQTVDAKLYDIDLFDANESVIRSLKAKGKIVICYFSAGSYENWRSDENLFPLSTRGNSNGWAGEKWLDIRQIGLLSPVMTARMDLAKAKGCDGLEPDNIDGYTNSTGFTLTAADQIAYNKFLATEAHKRGLLIGLKNDVDQIAALEPFFDFAVNEQCFQYNECDTYQPFLKAGKAVFNVEYSLDVSRFCNQANTLGIMSMKKKLDLDASRTVCWTTSPTSTPNVTTTATLNVRSTAGGTLIGTQPQGATGISSPETQVTINGTTWIYVNFTTGFDGYVSAMYLAGSGVSTNNQALITSLLAQLAVLQAALTALLAQ